MHIARILVLGATGRVGGVLRGCWPHEQVRWQGRRRLSGPEGQGDWVVFDPLEDPDALAHAARGTTAILCLAGVVPGRGGHLEDNTTLAMAAIRAGAQSGARVLLASSSAVYGAQAGVLDEAAPLTPANAYGHAKVDMERRGADLARELGVRVCALRIGNIAGIDAILGGWRAGFELDRFGDGRTPRRSYIGPVTLARVLGDLLAADTLPDVLNVASPGPVEMGALLDAAGLGWVPRPAPDTAIAEVALSTDALARFTTLPETTPAALVQEWRASGKGPMTKTVI